MVAHGAPFRLGAGQMIGALAEADRVARADAGTGGTGSLGAAVGTQIAFHRMMAARIVPHGPVGAGGHAFAAAGAQILVDRDDAGLRMLRDRLRIDRTGAQTGGPFAVLTGHGEEIEPGFGAVAEPDHPVAVLPGAQAVFLLAGDLAALAADAALEIEHQGETAHR